MAEIGSLHMGRIKDYRDGLKEWLERPVQHDAHVQEYYFRRRTGLMVLQPRPPAVLVGNS